VPIGTRSKIRPGPELALAGSHLIEDPSRHFDATAGAESDRESGRVVALKLTPRVPDAEDGGRIRVSFIREVQILRVSSPLSFSLLFPIIACAA
jgi:hypothetical protein